MLPASVAFADATDDLIKKQMAEFDQKVMDGNPQAAMAIFQKMQSKYRNHASLLAWQGRVALMQRNGPAAMEALNRALQLEPDHPIANAVMASLEFQTGKQPQAIQRIEKALVKNPDSPDLLQLSAELKMQQMQSPEALKIWQKIADNKDNTDMQRANAYSKVGELQMQAGQHVAAADALGKALSYRWHPNVAMAHIQMLHKSGAGQEAVQAIAEFKKKLDADPRLAQVKAQALKQLRPIESDLVYFTLEADLKAEKFNAYLFDSKAKRARKALEGKTDEASKQKLAMVDTLILDGMMRDLKETLGRKSVSSSWIKKKAGQLKEQAAKVSGDKASNAIDFANQAIADVESKDNAQIESALALAKSGWSLQDFAYPDDDQKKVLQGKGLPILKGSYGPLGEALEQYYSARQSQRQAPAYEELAKQFIDNPTDAAMQARLANAFYEHARKIDATGNDGYNKVLPPMIWAKIPGKTTSPNWDKAIQERYDNAYTLWNNYKVNDRLEARRWDDLIAGYDRIIEVYPLHGALIGRAKVHYYAGNDKQAFEDMAASVAVKAWEYRHTFYRTTYRNAWVINGVQSVLELHDVLAGKGSAAKPYPTLPTVEMTRIIREKKWGDMGPYLLMEHNKESFAKRLIDDMKFGPKLNRVAILNALAKQWTDATKDQAKRDRIVEQAKVLNSQGHPAFGSLEIQKDMSDEQKVKILEGIARNTELGGAYEPFIHYLLASIYEKQGDIEKAKFQYNAGAGGWNADQLKDKFQLACAKKRDQLEGEVESKELFDRYVAHQEDFKKRSAEFKNDTLELYRWECVINRLLALKVKTIWALHKRHTIRTKLKFYEGAVKDLRYVQEHDDTAKQDVIAALLGFNYMKMGDYENAIAEYSKAIGLGYNKTWAYIDRGELYRSAGKAKEAVEDFSKVLEIDPDNDKALEERADLYEWYLKDNKAALADLEKQRRVRISKRAKLKTKDPLATYKLDTNVIDFRIANLKSKIAKGNLDKMFGN
ncbi:MAG: tetratricopeptide repeat protein [Phycisphaeraceae bacterium JB051]